MPACRDCQWLLPNNTCAVGHVHPLRNCITAIMWEYANLLQTQHHVLEIGCGAWSPVKEHAEQIGCRWEGIDVNRFYQDQPTIATRIASVEAIPFSDSEFDIVIATQSMEHWEEYRVDLRKGLSEVFRVLKPGGWALINVPIYFHGGSRFVLGKVHEITMLVQSFADEIQVDAWRHPPDPLPPHRHHLRLYWHKPSLWNKSGYVLDIRAHRRSLVPYFEHASLTTWNKLWTGLYYRGPLHYVSRVVYSLLARVGIEV